jgi:hypothetical protein
MRATVSFSIEPFGDYTPPVFAVLPVVNGTPLTELISAFEAAQHFEPAGGYRGLIPQFFNYGRFDRYFMGEFESGGNWAQIGCVYLLGCDCGEVGCWPLECQIQVDGDAVVWHSFKQPHRPERDYSIFGPFVFDARQYREAVVALNAKLSARLPADS